MTNETRTIEVPVYRDPDGLPCCGRCPMLGVVHGRMNGFCCYDRAELKRDASINWIRPSPNCPLWKGEK